MGDNKAIKIDDMVMACPHIIPPSILFEAIKLAKKLE
tara:strand:- start:521 stop:631 length:111 start_codon:yes stop_codon:yes gene_type:complete